MTINPRISKLIGELWEAIRADVKLDECAMWLDRSTVSIADAMRPSRGNDPSRS
jgi:hypothetical protein